LHILFFDVLHKANRTARRKKYLVPFQIASGTKTAAFPSYTHFSHCFLKTAHRRFSHLSLRKRRSKINIFYTKQTEKLNPQQS
jgi:hypothetical protein